MPRCASVLPNLFTTNLPTIARRPATTKNRKMSHSNMYTRGSEAPAPLLSLLRCDRSPSGIPANSLASQRPTQLFQGTDDLLGPLCHIIVAQRPLVRLEACSEQQRIFSRRN